MPDEKSAYEGMFLLSQATAADLAGAVGHIDHLLGRAGAEVLAMQKWDERRLAFEIDKQRRGVYILTYFVAPRASITSLENDINLSETIMRALITRADHLSEDQMRAHDQRQTLETEAKLRAEKQAEKQAAAAVTVRTAEEKAAEQQRDAEQPSAESDQEDSAEQPVGSSTAGRQGDGDQPASGE